MKSLEVIAEEQDVISTLTTDVDFDGFIDQMLSLDKATYDRIYDDPKEREVFSRLAVQDRLAYFSPDFQTELQSIYQNFHAIKQVTHSLALNVYNIGVLTGASYKEIAERLEAGFQKQFSRSYISKLYRVGKMLTIAPSLSVVSDTEKLAELSRIPEGKLAQMIEKTSEGIVRVANCDIAQASRAQIQNIVRKEMPAKQVIKPASREEEVSSGIYNPIWSTQILRAQLEESLRYVNQSDLSSAIENCIRIIDKK